MRSDRIGLAALLTLTASLAGAPVARPLHAAPETQDFDKDGVPDLEDDCPTDPGDAANAGCRSAPQPAAAPRPVAREADAPVVNADEIVLPRPVEFETGSARLAASAAPLIETLASALEDLPEGKVLLVRGHTDNRGARVANQLLSRRRAEAVVKALVARGIAAQRLASEGLGPDEPVADNGSDEGRSKNRRVEFKIVDAKRVPKKKAGK